MTPLVIDGNHDVSHLGGYRSGAAWSWITGEPWSHTNWFPGEPHDNSGNAHYLAPWVSPESRNDIFPEYVAE